MKNKAQEIELKAKEEAEAKAEAEAEAKAEAVRKAGIKAENLETYEKLSQAQSPEEIFLGNESESVRVLAVSFVSKEILTDLDNFKLNSYFVQEKILEVVSKIDPKLEKFILDNCNYNVRMALVKLADKPLLKKLSEDRDSNVRNLAVEKLSSL